MWSERQARLHDCFTASAGDEGISYGQPMLNRVHGKFIKLTFAIDLTSFVTLTTKTSVMLSHLFEISPQFHSQPFVGLLRSVSHYDLVAECENSCVTI